VVILYHIVSKFSGKSQVPGPHVNESQQNSKPVGSEVCHNC